MAIGFGKGIMGLTGHKFIISPSDKPHFHFENEKRFRPVGCFRDKIKKEDRALPVLVKNYRANGELDWLNLKDVILRCAEVITS